MATVCPCPVPAKRKTPFQLSIKAGFPGGPMVGTSIYTNLVLKDALDINVIYVNNIAETVQALQFTFDAANAKLSRFQSDGVTLNPWQYNDVLVINYARLI